jgi:hypothetical protein
MSERLQNVWRFLCAVVRPFGHTMTGTRNAPWEVIQIIIPLVLVGGGIQWWNHNTARISLGVLAAYLTIGIFLAWEREYKERRNLESARQPRIRIDAIAHNILQMDGSRPKILRLEITNISESILRNCQVREKSFVNFRGHTANQRRYFRLAEDTLADMAQHTHKREFTLQGRGASELIDIALLDESKSDSRIIMLYATTPTSQSLNALHRGLFPHRLTVSVTSDDILIAEERTYDIKITDTKLQIVQVT